MLHEDTGVGAVWEAGLYRTPGIATAIASCSLRRVNNNLPEQPALTPMNPTSNP